MKAETISKPSARAVIEQLLNQKGPAVSKRTIDFANSPLPEYTGLYAVMLDNVLSQEECDFLLDAAESTGSYERAMINVGYGRQAMDTSTRNCGRIIFDDQHVADLIWGRVKPHVPEIQRIENNPDVTGKWPQLRKQVWKFSRLNERMRYLKYEGGEYFRPHCDGMYETPDKSERSYYTLHLYLNDEKAPNAERRLLKGGATTFHNYFGEGRVDVLPKAGSILIFQQKGLVHSGDDVENGTKYTMRTDMMFDLAEEGISRKEAAEASKKTSLVNEPAGWET